MEKLKEMLWEELEEISRKPEMGAGDLEIVHKLTDTIKNIDKICMLEDGGGYSRDDGMYHGRGSSYAGRPGRRGGSRRDSRGRYSRDEGRSEMLEHIEMAMDAADEKDRETIKRLIRQLETA